MLEIHDEEILSAALSYSDWEDGEVTPHGCGVMMISQGSGGA